MRNSAFTPPEEMWSLIIQDNGVLKVRMSNYTKEVATVPGEINLNTWYHAVFTYDNAELKLYLNGTLVGSAMGQNLLSTTSTNGICFGLSSQVDGYYNPFNGVIDNAGMWSRALTQCEVTELYTEQDCILNAPVLDASQDKEVVKIIDLMGRETDDKPNTVLIYVYSDGSQKKVFRVE